MRVAAQAQKYRAHLRKARLRQIAGQDALCRDGDLGKFVGAVQDLLRDGRPDLAGAVHHRLIARAQCGLHQNGHERQIDAEHGIVPDDMEHRVHGGGVVAPAQQDGAHDLRVRAHGRIGERMLGDAEDLCIVHHAVGVQRLRIQVFVRGTRLLRALILLDDAVGREVLLLTQFFPSPVAGEALVGKFAAPRHLFCDLADKRGVLFAAGGIVVGDLCLLHAHFQGRARIVPAPQRAQENGMQVRALLLDCRVQIRRDALVIVGDGRLLRKHFIFDGAAG